MNDRLRQGLYHTLLWLVALLFFAPVFWIALSSFKTAPQILAVPPIVLFRPTSRTMQRSSFSPLFSAISSTAWRSRSSQC